MQKYTVILIRTTVEHIQEIRANLSFHFMSLNKSSKTLSHNKHKRKKLKTQNHDHLFFLAFFLSYEEAPNSSF